MSMVEMIDGADSGPKFGPSLSLRDIRAAVRSLNEHQLDVLAYIGDGDIELCKVAGTEKAYLENYLSKMYKVLGINNDLPSAEKRKAALLMNKMYDTEGWRPEEQDVEFLVMARTSGSAARVDPKKVIVPLSPSANGSDVLAADIKEQASVTPLPSVEDVAERMSGLTPWKSKLLGWSVAGLTKEQMLKNVLEENDTSADLSTIENGLRSLYKALRIRNAYGDESAHALILKAYEVHTAQPPATEERAGNETGTDNDGALSADVESAPPDPPLQHQAAEEVTTTISSVDLEPIVERITKLMADGGVSETRIRVLDQLLVTSSYEDAAARLNMSASSNVSSYVSVIKGLFEIPKGSSDTARTRIDQERDILIAAWRLYRERNPIAATDATSDQSGDQTESNPPAVIEPEVEVTETPATAETVIEPEPPVVEADPEAVTPAEAREPEMVQQPEPVVESEPTPPADPEPAPQAPAPEQRVETVTIQTSPTSDGLLRDPPTIQHAMLLWSNSPTFNDDQTAAIQEGYRMERIDHIVSFHPVFQAVSVIVLFKRA